MRAAEISLTGMDVEWQRLQVISENLANANSASVGHGGPYRQKHLVSGPRSDFASYLETAETLAAAAAPCVDPNSLDGVRVYGIEESDTAPRMVHEPGNPQANAQGFVAYPNIDQAEEMTLMVKTTRAYEADLVALDAAHRMEDKALNLGKSS